MEKSATLSFEGGLLNIRKSGHGEKDGSGFFQFDEADIEWLPHDEKEGHYLRLEVERSELIELRDYLIEHLS